MPRLLQIFNRYLSPGGEEKSPPRVRELLAGEFEIQDCFFHSADWKGPGAPAAWKQALWTLYNPASINAVRRMQSEYQASAWVVHNVFPVGSAGIYREAWLKGIPIIYFIHNFRPFSVNATLWVNGKVNPAAMRGHLWPEIRHGTWQNSVVKTAIMAGVLKTAFKRGWLHSIKAWIACSDFMRHTFAEAGIRPDAIFTLRYAYKPMVDPAPQPEGDFYFFISRLVEEKGVAPLLQAWETVRKEAGVAAPRLVIAGGGPLAPLCERAAEGNDRVVYRGRISDEEKATLLATCRGVIAPSLGWEPLNITPYEAYDNSKPVLASAIGGLTESVLHGETGFLHEAGDSSQLARQVLELEKDAGRRREMGRRGREWLLGVMNEEEWREEFKKVYEFALNRRD